MNPKSIYGKAPQAVSHMDGLRLAFEDDTWLLIRPSGTEPVVRVYAEGFSVEERDGLLDAAVPWPREPISFSYMTLHYKEALGEW